MAGRMDDATILVTGASSGIGMAIARQVAPRAKVLVLVARRLERLDELKKVLAGAHPKLRIENIRCDLSVRAEVEALVAEVRARELVIDVLVNNAGVGLMGLYDQADARKTAAMIDLNVTSLMLLTLAFLPGMVERRRGGVLNVSSGFGLAVLPVFAAYAASKHFVTSFHRGPAGRSRGYGRHRDADLSRAGANGFETSMGNPTGTSLPAFVEITPEYCAKIAVRAFDRGSALVIPGILMKLVLMANGLAPRVVRRLFGDVLGRYARRKLSSPVL